MNQYINHIIFATLFFPITTQALNANLKQKYPHTVLTNDYGLLNKTDLDSELDGVKHPPVFSKKTKGYIYWQCFKRNSVSVSLEDLGDSPEEDPESDVKYNGENNAKLIISASNENKIIHKYVMWSNFPLSITENRFNDYINLMHGEKNICIAGSYLKNEKKNNKNKNK